MKVELSESFYAEADDADQNRCGQVFHAHRNQHGGSVATPIARFFITRPDIGAEGYNPHVRLDCYVRRHELAPPADWLANCLAAALLESRLIAEPVWIGWHHSIEIGGRAQGAVFEEY